MRFGIVSNVPKAKKTTVGTMLTINDAMNMERAPSGSARVTDETRTRKPPVNELIRCLVLSLDED